MRVFLSMVWLVCGWRPAGIGAPSLLLLAVGAACPAHAPVPEPAPVGRAPQPSPLCQKDADCVFNPVDCSECGRCPGSPPMAVSRSQVDELQAECNKHPPVRLNPRAGALGLRQPACSPCPDLADPQPLWRAVCRRGGCTVEQAGVVAGPLHRGARLASPDRPAILDVELGVKAPFSSASLSLDARGKLKYHASSWSPAPAREQDRSVQVPRHQTDALFRLIINTDLFSQAGKWSTRGQDCLTYSLIITTKTGKRSFGCTCGCPDDMDRIVSELQKMMGQAILIEGF